MTKKTKTMKAYEDLEILPVKALGLFAYFVLTFITPIKYSAEITSKNGHVKIELYLIRGFRMRTVFQLSSVPQEVITPEKGSHVLQYFPKEVQFH